MLRAPTRLPQRLIALIGIGGATATQLGVDIPADALAMIVGMGAGELELCKDSKGVNIYLYYIGVPLCDGR